MPSKQQIPEALLRAFMLADHTEKDCKTVRQMCKDYMHDYMYDTLSEDSPFSEIYGGFRRDEDEWFIHAVLVTNGKRHGGPLLTMSNDGTEFNFDTNFGTMPAQLTDEVKELVRMTVQGMKQHLIKSIIKPLTEGFDNFTDFLVQEWIKREEPYGDVPYLVISYNVFVREWFNEVEAKAGCEEVLGRIWEPIFLDEDVQTTEEVLKEFITSHGGDLSKVHFV